MQHHLDPITNEMGPKQVTQGLLYLLGERLGGEQFPLSQGLSPAREEKAFCMYKTLTKTEGGGSGVLTWNLVT